MILRTLNILNMGHSSPEITLKHYAHKWSGADTAIADAMTGNKEIKTAEQTKVQFNGNQALNKGNVRSLKMENLLHWKRLNRNKYVFNNKRKGFILNKV